MRRFPAKPLASQFRFALPMILLPGSSAAMGQPPIDSPFVAVMVDAKTEGKLGPFPYDRKVYADAIRALRKSGARAVIVKFFLDQPKTKEGDAALARELHRLPAFLQAMLNDSEPSPNPLPDRFTIPASQGAFDRTLSADSGWIPAEPFAKAGHGIGFVDLRSADEPLKIPLVERYKGRTVPSLYLSTLQFIFGGALRVVDGKNVAVGTRTLPVDAYNEVAVSPPAVDDLNAISLIDLLEGRAPAESFRNKIVVLGYDGDNQPVFKTPIGIIKAHRLFYYALLDLYNKLKS